MFAAINPRALSLNVQRRRLPSQYAKPDDGALCVKKIELALSRLLLHVLEVIATELLLELLNTARRVDKLLRASEERVTGRANFHGDLLDRAASRERISATATDGRFREVFWVNLFFHGATSCWAGATRRSQLLNASV